MKKLKILFITQEFSDKSGGAGVYVYELSKAMSENGQAEVHILAPGEKTELKAINKNLILHTVKTINAPLAFVPSFHFQVWRHTKKIINNHDIDTIHSNHNAGLMAMGYRPSTVTIHHPVSKEQRFTTFKQRIINMPDVFMEKKSMKRADLIDVDCNVIRDLLLKIDPKLKSKISVIPLGINVSKYYPREEKSLKNRLGIGNAKIIFFPGGARAKRKGTLHLIRSLGKLTSQAKYVCLISGKSREMGWKKEMDDQILLSGVQDKLMLVGEIPYVELPDYYAIADFIVFPSLFEGFGLPILESMAFGKPVVATNTGIAPEIIKNNENGILIQPGDEKALRISIDSLLNDRQKNLRLGRSALETIKEGYSWQAVADKVLKEHHGIFYAK